MIININQRTIYIGSLIEDIKGYFRKYERQYFEFGTNIPIFINALTDNESKAIETADYVLWSIEPYKIGDEFTQELPEVITVRSSSLWYSLSSSHPLITYTSIFKILRPLAIKGYNITTIRQVSI